jgi:uncharacterized integral membrane protein
MIASAPFSGIFWFKEMIRFLKTVLLTLLFIAGITFAVENTQPFVLRYYFGLESPPIPLFLLVLLSVLLGIFLAGVGFLFDQWSLRRALRQKERELESLRKELKPYREQDRVMQG